jgi:serine/threonine protein kinase/tetratricopeptide (TPR) repeat protein
MPEPATGPFEPSQQPEPTSPFTTAANITLTSTRAGDGASAGTETAETERRDSLRGRFTILKEHACGGLGQVSLARDEKLKRQVALKEIRPDRRGSAHLRERFLTEAEITGQLEHPGIVPVYAMDEGPDGEPYYAMRFIQGRTLAEAIREFHDGGTGRRRDGAEEEPASLAPSLRRSVAPSFSSLAFRNLLQRFVSVCNTVAYAHSKGVIHRDLKPANVMLGDYGETLVLDWGLAKRIDGATGRQGDGDKTNQPDAPAREQGAEGLTEAGQVLGTAAYMSPEQAAGDSENVGPATDTYALGAMLYQLLTGRAPYHGSNNAEIVAQVKSSPPQRPSEVTRGVPKALEAVCVKAMARFPAERYTTASDLAKDIERWLADEPVLAYREPLRERLWRWMRGHPLFFTSAATVLVVGVVALTVSHLREVGLRRQAERSATAAKEAEADAEAFGSFLASLLSAPRPEGKAAGLGVNVTVKAALDEARPLLALRFEGQPRAEAKARAALGKTYAYLGEYGIAVEELERALKLYSTYMGPNDSNTLNTMNNLAHAYQRVGKLDKALALFQETFRRKEATLGPDDRSTLATKDNLAAAHADGGDWRMAIPLHEQVLAASRANLGPDDPDTLNTMNNLAFAYLAGGRVREALSLFEATLELQGAKLGPDHYDVLMTMGNLARAYRRAGRMPEALPIYEKVLERKRATLGSEHHETIRALNNLANAYDEAGRSHQAVPLYEEALRLSKTKLGPEHPDTLVTMANLANAYAGIGRLDKAEPLFQEALRLLKVKRGEGHPDTLTAMHNLARTYRNSDRVPEAIRVYKEILRLSEEELGVNHPDALMTMMNLAEAYWVTDRLSEARTLYEECLRRRLAQLGPDHPDTLVSMWSLGALHAVRKDYQVAEEQLLQCQAGVERNLENMPPSLREGVVSWLVRLYDAWGKHTEADKWFAKMPAKHKLQTAFDRHYAWPLLWGWPRF